ncbi:MAG: XisI protein [Fibrella sp.]|nr:XisI protein [Armatimonadota bacterium]
MVLVFDEQNDCYIIMALGWESRTQRTYRPVIHLDIVGGKVYI